MGKWRERRACRCEQTDSKPTPLEEVTSGLTGVPLWMDLSRGALLGVAVLTGDSDMSCPLNCGPGGSISGELPQRAKGDPRDRSHKAEADAEGTRARNAARTQAGTRTHSLIFMHLLFFYFYFFASKPSLYYRKAKSSQGCWEWGQSLPPTPGCPIGVFIP